VKSSRQPALKVQEDQAMKTLLVSLTAAALAAAVTPAAAQYYQRGYQHDYSPRAQATTGYVDSLDWKITNAAQQGRISWQQARELRGELRQVQPIAYRVQTGQANGWQRQRLDRTVARIERAVSGYATNERYNRYDRWRR
jgi:hypothetical protein